MVYKKSITFVLRKICTKKNITKYHLYSVIVLFFLAPRKKGTKKENVMYKR